MQKRRILFGTYDTAAVGLWTLTSYKLSDPAQRTNYVEVPGRDGDLDVSTALTDGEPRYGNRTLTATLECSEGTRLDREETINTMTNWLDGWRMNIVLPDDEGHYLTGRVSVAKGYNDPAHAAVTVTAICDPWRYNAQETIISLSATDEAQQALLRNMGRRTVVPTLTIAGESASVNLVVGTASWVLSAGIYQLPDLVLKQGGQLITYSGLGTLQFVYREAVL